jgi:hypothetical protein
MKKFNLTVLLIIMMGAASTNVQVIIGGGNGALILFVFQIIITIFARFYKFNRKTSWKICLA